MKLNIILCLGFMSAPLFADWQVTYRCRGEAPVTLGNTAIDASGNGFERTVRGTSSISDDVTLRIGTYSEPIRISVRPVAEDMISVTTQADTGGLPSYSSIYAREGHLTFRTNPNGQVSLDHRLECDIDVERIE